MAKLMTGTSKTTLSAVEIAAKREEAARKLREAEEAARETGAEETDDEKNDDDEAVDVSSAEEIEQINVSGGKRYAFIQEIAELLNDDENFLLDIRENVLADKRKKYAIVPVLMDMRRVLKSRMDTLPVPGTDEKNSNNPDIYTRMVRNPTTGLSSARKRSTYLDLAELTAEGVEALNIKAQIEGKEYDKKLKEAELEDVKSTLSTVKNNMRKAAALHWQLEAVNDLPAVNVDFIEAPKGKEGFAMYDAAGEPEIDGTGKHKKAIKSPSPLCMYDNGKPPQTHVCSVTTFLTYDVKKAKENGGNLQAVLDTRKRDTGEKGEIKIKADMAPEVGLNAFSTLLQFVNDQKKWASTLKLLNKGDAANDVKTVGDFYLFLNDYFWPKFKARHTTITEEQDAAALEQAEAERKARLQKQARTG